MASKSREIVLEREVRAFMRAFPNGKLLSHHHLQILPKGQKLALGESQSMTYDHRSHQVAQIIGEDPERFIILAELVETPWHMPAHNWAEQSTL